MIRKAVPTRRCRLPGPKKNRPETLKLAALLSLRKAIREERYEDCPRFIAAASGSGALPSEIRNILLRPYDGLEGE